MKQFKVGSAYEACEIGLDPITITIRTAKTIYVTNGMTSWGMRIDYDKDGNEIAIDKSVPKRYRDLYTYCARLEVK